MLKRNRFVLLLHIFSILLNNINPIVYTVDNSRHIFALFKQKYKRLYDSREEEQYRYKIFIKNLNEIEKLNNETIDKKTFFIINQYGDLNPKEIENHYALSIKPYTNVSDNANAEFVGRQQSRNLNRSELFNLDNSEKLYKDFMRVYNKINTSNEYDHTVRYLRFVKTLVDLNKRAFQGRPAKLNVLADIVQEPNIFSSY